MAPTFTDSDGSGAWYITHLSSGTISVFLNDGLDAGGAADDAMTWRTFFRHRDDFTFLELGWAGGTIQPVGAGGAFGN